MRAFESSEDTQGGKHGGAGAAAKRETVLIVDDDEAFREAVGELVTDEGMAVATASNGQEALALLASGLQPIAILLDMMMPVMDGPEFRRAQLTIDGARAIPVAVMSASGTSRQQVEALFGDVDYLPKPTGGAAILSFLNRCRARR